MARPRKEIDQKQFESLCALQCTGEEILDFFNVTDRTLNAWCKRTYGAGFQKFSAKKREGENIPQKTPDAVGRKERHNGDLARQAVPRADR